MSHEEKHDVDWPEAICMILIISGLVIVTIIVISVWLT